MSTSLSVLAALADLVLPGGCVGCPAGGPALCSTCRDQLRGPARPTAPTPAPGGFPPTWRAAPYDGAARAAILAHKEHGRVALARPLGAALALAAEAALEDFGSARVLVVPMPSRRAALRARGHDPMGRIARRAVASLARSGREVQLVCALRASDRLADQTGLGQAGRAANLAGALDVPPRLRRLVGDRPALIVDDVVTTGASLAEAARALRAAGADVRSAAVIAATTLRRGAAEAALRWPS